MNKTLINKFLGYFPITEVLLRNIYGRFSFFRNILKLFKNKKLKVDEKIEINFYFKDLISLLKSEGIKEDDVVLIHSNMDELAKCDIGPKEIVYELINKLCPKGTLVAPTFPLYPDNKNNINRITKDMTNVKYSYDLKRSLPWTGLLGLILMKVPGSRRSIHPLNTLVSYGKSTNEIFRNESYSSLDLPCGINSSWSSLLKLNAKIICIGVDMAHSLTMIHVAEDCYEDTWPVKNWYRKRVFDVIDGDTSKTVYVRERHPKWSMSIAQERLNLDLYKDNIAKKIKLGSLEFSILESTNLIKYLRSKSPASYPFYYPNISNL